MKQRDLQETGNHSQFWGQNEFEENTEDSFLGNLDFIRFLHVLQKNIFWIFLFLFISFTGAFLYIRYTKQIFESESIIKLDNKKETTKLGLDQLSGGGDLNSKMSNLSGEIELIKSNLIIEKLINVLNLKTSYFAYGKISYMERYKTSPFSVKVLEGKLNNDIRYNVDIIDQQNFTFTEQGSKNIIRGINNKPFQYGHAKVVVQIAPLLEELSTPEHFFIINSDFALAKQIGTDLSVEVLNPDANTIRVAYKDHDKLKAYDIVRVIDSIYQIESLKKNYQTQEQTINFLNQQLKETEDNLELYEMQIESFARKNKTVDVRADLGKSVEKVEVFDKEQIDFKLQIKLLDELKDIIHTNEDLKTHIPTLAGIGDAQIVTGIVALNKLQIERELLLSSYSEGTFVIKSKDIEILNLKDNLKELIDHNKKLLSSQLSSINERVGQLDNYITSLPSKDTEFNRLKRYFNLYEKFYLMLMEKKAEFGISKAGTVPQFTILSQPSVPHISIFPKKIPVYLGAFAISFFMSLVLLVIRYYLHNTINNQGELERTTLAPVLGIVPKYTKEKLDVSRLVVHQNPKSPLSESLRSIRTNLEFMLGSRKQKRILSVTSTISGEGKTFVAVNLGGVIAMSGIKTVILDLDMRKPKVNLAFGVDNDKGMSTILIGKHSVSDCVHHSAIDGYDFIAAGPTPPNPSELILRPEFDELLTNLAREYDVIIIDTPPVGLVTDGVIIMQKADLPIYVVRSEYSKKGFERNINRLIQKNGFNNLSVILNGFNPMQGYGYGYQYGYGYGYGYYNNEEESKENGLLSKTKKAFKKK